MSSEYARGRVAGINEAVARMDLMIVSGDTGVVRAAIEACIRRVTALLPPLPEPPADAEVAQAERAVIEAAIDWWNMAGPGGDEGGTNALVTSCWALETARQRSAAAKEQG